MKNIVEILLTQLYLFPVLLYKQVISDCRLHPISYGFYYGINQKTFKEAKACCKGKDMSIVLLKTKTQLHQLRDALLSESFWAEPIGPANGLFVTTNSKSRQGYYPLSFAKGINGSIEEGDGFSKICSIIFISSPRTAELKIMGVDCKMPNRYVCERKSKFDISLCTQVNYTELVEDTYIYSYDKIFFQNKLEWRNAADCCEMKGGELFRYSSSSEKENLYTAFIDNAIIRRNDSLSFWTGGFKKLDKYKFTWSNYETVMYENIENNYTEEFCLSGITGDKDVILKDYPCEQELNFVCRIDAPGKCHGVDMQVLPVQDSFRMYFYSDHYKLSWSEAVLCCRARGLRLLSVISPQEGNYLSSHFQGTEILRYRHQGFRFGIWTSGRQHKEGPYEFVAVKTKVQFGKSGKNHYVEGNTNGTCLQYIVDVRNSYLLNNIPCKSIRSFVCETPETTPLTTITGTVDRLPIHLGINMKELGNKYYYSNTKTTWSDASDLCKSHEMSLLDVRNAEEKSAMTLILQQLLKNTFGEVNGLWSVAPERSKSMELNPKPKVLQNNEQRKNRFRGLARYRSNFRQLRARTKGFKPISGAVAISTPKTGLQEAASPEKYCSVTYLSEQRIRTTHDHNCTDKLNFICEKQDPLYGKCDPKAINLVSEYAISHKLTSWKEARKCCEKIGRSLVALSEPKTIINVYHQIKEKYQRPQVGIWTSGTNAIVPVKWIWIGNYKFLESDNFFHNYTTSDVMSNVEDNHECLEAFAHNQEERLMWDHDDCDKVKPYMCDKVTSPPQPCLSIRFERLRRTAFYYGMGPVRWAQAQECCLERGMTLAEIHGSEANDLLFQFVAERSHGIHNDPELGLWIGLTSYISNHTTFTWTNSMKTIEETNFTSWNPMLDLPFDHKLPCVGVYTDVNTFSWRNLDCSRKLKFICQVTQR